MEFLGCFLKLEKGIPSHDTFSRVFRLLDPEEFHSWFLGFMEQFAQGCQGVVALDGKTRRRSYDRAEGSSSLHLVNALPQLLQLLSLAGTVVSTDAMHCQRQVAQQVVEPSADYVLALKGNQGRCTTT